MGICGSKSSQTKEEPKATAAPQQQSQTSDPSLVQSLPTNAVKVHCHHVYDGDTLTLNDQQRVRLLGIDTPEISEHQPFATEARDELRRMCAGKDIYIVEGPGPSTDKYGRLLRFVYVNEGNAYRFANLRMVREGLASYYHPDDSPFPYTAEFLQSQRDARTHKAGKWKSFDSAKEVVVTRNGKAYHIRSCAHIAAIRNLQPMTCGEAVDKGYSGCRDCSGE